MSKFVNKTGTLGPYPGFTWEEHAKKDGWTEDSPFGYMICQQIKKGSCDHWDCSNEVSEEYHFCSKECYENWENENQYDSECEARGS